MEVQDKDFKEKVLENDKLVLVDFWAEWCGPCRTLSPIIDEIADDYKGKVEVAKVDIDQNQEYAAKYGVRNIPTVLLFKNGEIVDKHVGVAPKKKYVDSINQVTE
ncbi:MAG: thioredoxin [Psychroflexus sp.]|jgi:thioredoxin 1|nr:thioredoxin [Psychroflexus sp.]